MTRVADLDPYDLVADEITVTRKAEIDRFWEAFAAQAADLDQLFTRQKDGVDPVAAMAPLAEVDPQLMWEFGPAEGGHCICITAEGRMDLRALARAVVNARPEIPGWSAMDQREPTSPDLAVAVFEGRFQRQFALEEIEISRGHDNRLDLVGHGRGAAEELADQVYGFATITLGEAEERIWLGFVDGAPRKSGWFKRRRSLDIAGFNEELQAEIGAVRADLPEAPYAARDLETGPASMANLEIGPSARPDLITFLAPFEPYLQACLTSLSFSSQRFSRFGEWFAFVRVPRTEAMPFDEVTERGQIEDSLHTRLGAADLGGVAAAGHGVDAVYIDLALTDLHRGPALVAEVLSDLPAFSETTLHFLEAGLVDRPFPLSTFRRPLQ
ncbi:MAG: hypothetical protein AAFV96_01510 [Pseudomonadota bacterium]